MSKSLKRVRAALEDAGITAEIAEMPDTTRTAAEAAAAIGCHLDQIAKSVIFRGSQSDAVILFVTAGGNRVDPDRANALADEPLTAADAAFVRASTGFVIGGVAPVGHLQPPRAFFDGRLLDFGLVWAAAGTPRHVFPIRPTLLCEISGAQLSDFASISSIM
jgi:prolyl-tRNA editing enzyme YbaK/EbsC (Cys-tRNA(Pro) deacylase)